MRLKRIIKQNGIFLLSMLGSLSLCLGASRVIHFNAPTERLGDGKYFVADVVDARQRGESVGSVNTGILNIKVPIQFENGLKSELLDFYGDILVKGKTATPLVVKVLRFNLEESSELFREKATATARMEFYVKDNGRVALVHTAESTAESTNEFSVKRQHEKNAQKVATECMTSFLRQSASTATLVWGTAEEFQLVDKSSAEWIAATKNSVSKSPTLKGLAIGYQNNGGIVEFNTEKRPARWFAGGLAGGVAIGMESHRTVTDQFGRNYDVELKTPGLLYFGPSARLIIPFGEEGGISFGGGIYAFVYNSKVTAERFGRVYSGSGSGTNIVFSLPLLSIGFVGTPHDGVGAKVFRLSFGVRGGPFNDIKATSYGDVLTIKANSFGGTWLTAMFGYRF